MTRKRIALMFLCVVTAVVAWQGAAAKEKKSGAAQGSDTERLMAAARSCDLPTLRALIASGTNLSATDENGMDALSYASLNRADMPVSATSKLFKASSGTHAKWTHIQWTLKCPLAVTALTEAGVDPWKSRFYQNPRLDESRPEMIAVIRVEDDRAMKGDSSKLLDQLTDGIEAQIRDNHAALSQLQYPVLGLSEARQRLRTSGFSAEDTMAPDRAKACNALGVDSVFEARLEDYRISSLGVVSAAKMRMNFALTDCKTGDLLWRSDLDYAIAEGWLASAFGGGKVKQVTNGFVGPPAVSFPPYEKRKE